MRYTVAYYLAGALSGSLFLASPATAQLSNPLSHRLINYKTIVDDPYDLNKLWIGFSPLAVGFGGSNASMGFNLNTRIFISKGIQITGQFQSSYGRPTDFQRNQAYNNASILYLPVGERREQRLQQTDKFSPFSVLEAGVMVPIKDMERKSTSRIMLTSKKAKVMEFTSVDEIVVNSKNRQIWGARLGGQLYASTVSLNKPMAKQSLTLYDEAGNSLSPSGVTTYNGQVSKRPQNALFANLQYAMVYVGGNYQLIRNVAIKADKFGNLANNIAISLYSDVLVAPSPILSDVHISPPTGSGVMTYSTKGVQVSKLGFRTGFDVFYNQDLHISYGAEAGIRPGLKGQGWYLMGKFSFPAFAFKLNRQRLANAITTEQ